MKKIFKMKYLILLVPFTFFSIVNYFNLNWSDHQWNLNNKNPKFVNSASSPTPLIIKTLQEFPFKWMMDAIRNQDQVKLDHLIEKLISKLIPFIVLQPKVPVNISCMIPQVPQIPENCDILKTPRKIGVLLQFGFEVDTLEIHLNELYDIVDQFFILESSRTHSRAYKKPLVWELVKNQDRFAKFLDKVTHFVVDDSKIALLGQKLLNVSDLNDWEAETLQERLRWEKFLKWNNAIKFFGNDDLLRFGDMDEIPSRNVIHRLKYCDMKTYPVDIGIWFPYGNIKNAFRTDHTVGNQPYTLGDPTYWTLKSANKLAHNNTTKNIYPSRNRGKSPTFLLGGVHMSNYGYLPLQIIKKMSKTERSIENIVQVIRLSETLSWSNIIYLEKKLSDIPIELIDRIVDLESIKLDMQEIAVLPWFYNCNRLRYPTWEGEHDTRLD